MYMALCTINSVISVIFTIVVFVSTNDSDRVLKDLNWSNGDLYVDLNTDATIWVSIYQYGLGNTDNLDKMNWSNDKCTEDYCSDCESAMKIVLAFMSLYFIFSVISVVTSSYRCIPTGNNRRFKNVSILVSVLAVASGVVCLVEYSTNCERKIKDFYRNNTQLDITWYYGPSFGLLIAAASLSFVNLLVHWRTPLTEDQRVLEYRRSLMDNSK